MYRRSPKHHLNLLIHRKARLFEAQQQALLDEPPLAPETPLVDVQESLLQLLESQVLEVWVQEKKNLHTEQHQGYEVLTRLNNKILQEHPAFEDLKSSLNQLGSPLSQSHFNVGTFSHLAKENALGPFMDYMIIERTFKTLAQKDPLQTLSTFNINVLPSTLCQPEFADRVQRLSEQYGIAMKHLCFEILETEAIADFDALAHTAIKLKKQGSGLALDDFCSGYANPDALRKVPLEEVKIPRLFLQMLDKPSLCQDAKSWIENMIRHAKSFGTSVTVEGIETQDQADFVKKLGADTAQGFLFSKPIPLQKAVEQLPIDPDRLSLNIHRVPKTPDLSISKNLNYKF